MLSLVLIAAGFASNASLRGQEVKSSNETETVVTSALPQHALSGKIEHANVEASYQHKAAFDQKVEMAKQPHSVADKDMISAPTGALPQHALSGKIEHANVKSKFQHKAAFDKKVEAAEKPDFDADFDADNPYATSAMSYGEVCEISAYGTCSELCSAADDYRSCLATSGCAADPASYVQSNCQTIQSKLDNLYCDCPLDCSGLCAGGGGGGGGGGSSSMPWWQILLIALAATSCVVSILTRLCRKGGNSGGSQLAF